MQIYLARNNQQAGPYTVEQLNQMLASQQVLLTDLIWHQGMTEWKPLGEITQGQLQYFPAGYEHASSTQNNPFQATPSTSQYDYQQTTTTPYQESQSEQLAPVAKRFFAKVIDLALWLPIGLFPSAFMNAEQHAEMAKIQAQGIVPSPETQQQLFNLIPDTAWAAMGVYVLVMLVLQAILITKSGQSLGKKAMAIQIVSASNNEPVGIGRAFLLRSGLFIVLNLILMPFITIIDYVFAISKRRQTLHDKVARTVVIDKK